jgi:hypothetical protein
MDNERPAHRSWGTVFDEAASAEIVRQQEAQLRAEAAAQSGLSVSCLWFLLLPVVLLLLGIVFQWWDECGLCGMVHHDARLFHIPPPAFASGLSGVFVRSFTGWLRRMPPSIRYVMSETVFHVTHILSAPTLADGFWMAGSYSSALSYSAAYLLLANALLLIVVGGLYSLLLVCVAGSITFCRRKKRKDAK